MGRIQVKYVQGYFSVPITTGSYNPAKGFNKADQMCSTCGEDKGNWEGRIHADYRTCPYMPDSGEDVQLCIECDLMGTGETVHLCVKCELMGTGSKGKGYCNRHATANCPWSKQNMPLFYESIKRKVQSEHKSILGGFTGSMHNHAAFFEDELYSDNSE